MSGDGLPAAVRALMPGLQADLARLVAIPSIAFPGFPEAPVRDAAEATLAILRDAGLHTAELIEIPGGPPAVFGELPGPPGAPTVLLYAHYDVQPPGDAAAWTTDPFTADERDGRLYGRGTADDKCGIVMHAGALRALLADGGAPVTLKIIVEGEEETGRGTFQEAVRADPSRFAADVVVVADSGNWKVGHPTLTTTLRGLAVIDVEVRTLAAPVHSGLFGGPVPDALIALARLIASLHDDDGDVAVAGLVQESWDGRPVEENDLRHAAGVAPGVELIGTGSLAEHLYMRPSLTVIGIDAPAIDGAGNALVPVARARISARLAPDQDPAAAQETITAHLQAHRPWGVQLTCTPREAAAGAVLTGGGPFGDAAVAAMRAAYDAEPVHVGSGGAIPLCVALAEAFPQAEIILWGACDDEARIHAADESVHLGDLERATLAQVLFLDALRPGDGTSSAPAPQ